MTTTPVEAGLVWTIAKTRRHGERANFPGAALILEQLTDKQKKPQRKRVGLIALGPGPAVRSHCNVYSAQDGDSSTTLVGQVTSGCPAPSLANRNIAMAYLASQLKLGQRVWCEVRGKRYEYELTRMPFVPTRYFV